MSYTTSKVGLVYNYSLYIIVTHLILEAGHDANIEVVEEDDNNRI